MAFCYSFVWREQDDLLHSILGVGLGFSCTMLVEWLELGTMSSK